MAEKLTQRPAAGSLESKFSTSSDSNTTDDDETDVLSASASAEQRGTLFAGVRRGIRKLGSVSGNRNKPANILTGESSSSAAATSISASPVSTPVSSGAAISATVTDQPSPRLRRHERSTSSLNVEKPLPKTPASPPVEQLLQAPTPFSPPDTPKATQMSRPAQAGTRTSTMDSATSGSTAQMYAGGVKSNAYGADANTSQSSIASSSRTDDDGETKEIVTPKTNGPASAGLSPQSRSAGGSNAANAANTATTSSTHLSGLMCNVHRTTGREPHPLVGATTTILGDKLYVFGGRILSRTRPSLTSEIYELDLIRRHWTKVETTGDIPPPRYFHSVCPLGDTKLVCYGGMSPAPAQDPSQAAAAAAAGQEAQPEVVVMSDIYIYDAPTRIWSFIPTQDTPQGRYAHCATILPSSATFTSATAPSSALHHNPPGSNPNQGTIGVNIDGTGGAEMVVVGGQDSANHYIEQISVFNLRSLKWTSTQQLGKSCGAYRSVVAPLPHSISSKLGKPENSSASQDSKDPGSSMLIYSNYNFLDVKLELQIRSPDGTLTEKPMQGTFSPPGLRFPNGGVIDTNFVVSGTYLTSSKQEYALWALDLKTLTWSRIDAGGNVFSQGSWNRGVLWNRRNTFVILGNRKRSLVEDYNHRRINFTNVCMVELEAFGLYDNPRKAAPMSGFVSASSPYSAPSLSLSSKTGWTAGGRALSKSAEDLGQMALGLRELCDMDILCVRGERIPINSRIVARRWGPYFVQLLREGVATQDGNDAATLRPENIFRHNQSRNSSITITPSLGGQSSNMSTSSTLLNPSHTNSVDPTTLLLPPDSNNLPPSSRPRTLYLPHTSLTIQALLHYLYTSSLPPTPSPLCSPQILCSLLQIARPYRIDGLLEAVVERLHTVLDSRNAAAVFNASAMAAGGGRSTSTPSDIGENWLSTSLDESAAESVAAETDGSSRSGAAGGAAGLGLRINTAVGNLSTGISRNAINPSNATNAEDDEIHSATSSVTSDVSGSDVSGSVSAASEATGNARDGREVWNGDVSAVIGLQKRGLRGLMEGRRLRERGASVGQGAQGGMGGMQQQRVGLGIGGP